MNHRRFPFLLLVLPLFTLLPTPIEAQTCGASGPRPYVCDLRVFAAQEGRRFEPISLERGLRLVAGGRAELAFEARDQFGREFPEERLGLRVETDRSCQGRLEVEERDNGRVVIAARAGRGACTLLLWVPGNLNLEWPLRIEVGALTETGYNRDQAQEIAVRLYHAILNREPDTSGLNSAMAEIQRGRLENVVVAMFESPEFLEKRASLSGHDLLESFYRGLLERSPDSAGLRTYLDDTNRRRYARVVLSLIESEEFETLLVERTTRGRP